MTQTGRPPCQTGNKPTPTGENIIHHFENAVKMGGGQQGELKVCSLRQALWFLHAPSLPIWRHLSKAFFSQYILSNVLVISTLTGRQHHSLDPPARIKPKAFAMVDAADSLTARSQHITDTRKVGEGSLIYRTERRGNVKDFDWPLTNSSTVVKVYMDVVIPNFR